MVGEHSLRKEQGLPHLNEDVQVTLANIQAKAAESQGCLQAHPTPPAAQPPVTITATPDGRQVLCWQNKTCFLPANAVVAGS